jgi:hypothetical protein
MTFTSDFRFNQNPFEVFFHQAAVFFMLRAAFICSIFVHEYLHVFADKT